MAEISYFRRRLCKQTRTEDTVKGMSCLELLCGFLDADTLFLRVWQKRQTTTKAAYSGQLCNTRGLAVYSEHLTTPKTKLVRYGLQRPKQTSARNGKSHRVARTTPTFNQISLHVPLRALYSMLFTEEQQSP